MKKFLLLINLSLFVGANSVHAQYPIPSYNILLNSYATFQEHISVTPNEQETRGKRKLIVKVTCGNLLLSACSATVWVYSLDGLDVLGPFQVTDAEDLSVEIDERAWGTRVETQDPIFVDVWIEEELKLRLPIIKMEMLPGEK